MELAYRNGVAQCTLANYEQDFADRHLLHGVIARWARETPDAVALIEYDTGRQYTYAEFDRIATAVDREVKAPLRLQVQSIEGFLVGWDGTRIDPGILRLGDGRDTDEKADRGDRAGQHSGAPVQR